MRSSDWSSDVCSSDLNRYARRIVSVFSTYLDAGRKAMPVPDVVPFAAWLRQLGGQSCFVPGELLPMHRLDAFGARHVWERAIGQAEAEHVLLDVPHAARLAMDADRLMSVWFLRVSPEEEIGRASCRERVCQYV